MGTELRLGSGSGSGSTGSEDDDVPLPLPSSSLGGSAGSAVPASVLEGSAYTGTGASHTADDTRYTRYAQKPLCAPQRAESCLFFVCLLVFQTLFLPLLLLLLLLPLYVSTRIIRSESQGTRFLFFLKKLKKTVSDPAPSRRAPARFTARPPSGLQAAVAARRSVPQPAVTISHTHILHTYTKLYLLHLLYLYFQIITKGKRKCDGCTGRCFPLAALLALSLKRTYSLTL